MDRFSDGFFGEICQPDMMHVLHVTFPAFSVPCAVAHLPPCLVSTLQEMSAAEVALVLGIKLLGLYIFRGANSQKDAFRRDPTGPESAHLRTLKTERGTQLIVSGWWGVSRHINYFGDWIMG